MDELDLPPDRANLFEAGLAMTTRWDRVDPMTLHGFSKPLGFMAGSFPTICRTIIFHYSHQTASYLSKSYEWCRNFESWLWSNRPKTTSLFQVESPWPAKGSAANGKTWPNSPGLCSSSPVWTRSKIFILLWLQGFLISFFGTKKREGKLEGSFLVDSTDRRILKNQQITMAHLKVFSPLQLGNLMIDSEPIQLWTRTNTFCAAEHTWVAVVVSYDACLVCQLEYSQVWQSALHFSVF